MHMVGIMDFDSLIKGYKSKTCIVSVERFPDGHFGNIRLAAGNKAHCDDMANVMHHPFVPDSPYEEYLPQNKNFEDFCVRCAFSGQPLHSYVRLPQMGLWLNMFLLPLESDKENIGYCIYSYDVTPVADTEQQVSLSADTSSAVLKTCIKLRGATDIKQKFSEVIGDIREICDSDHCCILLTDSNEKKCTKLCEAIRPGSGTQTIDLYLDDSFYAMTETWRDTIGDSTCLIIKNQEDREWLRSVNPVWYESLIGADVQTLVIFPLDYNGERLGYIWAGNFNVENTVKIKETLELTTFFLASEISNYQLLFRLQVLSSRDMLTGVMNRNEMNNYADSLISGGGDSSIGIVFADLNGLKVVNDTEGHNAGDKLLVNGASALKDVFDVKTIFRAGGDEFVVILTGITEDELQNKAESLEKAIEKYDGLSFAVGTAYEKRAADVRAALHTADERMYVDKKRYYDMHPEKTRGRKD